VFFPEMPDIIRLLVILSTMSDIKSVPALVSAASIPDSKVADRVAQVFLYHLGNTPRH
jgi:hypothetical protein